MKEHEITCDWIDRYNEDDLAHDERAMFQKRMLANPLLRAEVEIDASLDQFLRDRDLIDLMNKMNEVKRPGERGGSLPGSFLIAASFICLFMTGVIFYLVRTGTGTSSPGVLKHADHNTEQKARIPGVLSVPTGFHDYGCNSRRTGEYDGYRHFLAENYEPLPEFEKLTGSVTRSGQVVLFSPQVIFSVTAGTEVPFKWRYDGNSATLSLVIMDNHGIPVAEYCMLTTGSFKLKTNMLAIGLYYWKILVNDEMALMGKLIVRRPGTQGK